MKRVTDFAFLGSKITADGDCSHEIKRHLLLGRKAMTNLDSILKSRDVILLTKVCIVKAMDFPGKSTGVGCYFLLQGIFLTQVSCNVGKRFTLWATWEAPLPS